ncbi:glycosyltransferase family 4 protein [Shinella sp. PSBB067]|uniref:glycosyltransferase family 4 protein n=1 Tax=Shinella sp. PSBB067 TaxID=2715959 RepID=UPI00193C398F|nr:glycosyltransferase family 4 protein [Shinella sp. PSBB067]QRI61835.1 glycosyltransferase family 4 protein [Shinella sp. PSBB067]
MSRPRVLLLAEICNPEWPSLPVVGYKYARALASVADVKVATHVRNRPAIEAAGEFGDKVIYIDNEWIAGRMHKLSEILRGGSDVAWSTHQIMAYLPYLEFERQALRTFREELAGGAFDLVHRITPMSPTLPSIAASRGPVPFVIGPLNGNLDWPRAFQSEQKREREGMRRLRNLYKALPFARTTFTRAAAILAAFRHTVDDLPPGVDARVVPFPEVGFDPAIFHSDGRRRPFSGGGPYRFLYAGRLVPYKVPEVAVRAFVGSDALRPHRLHIVGDGPEEPRLRQIVAEAQAQDRVIFEGRKSQAEVAGMMRGVDAFIFPSIRELGAGVVVEAMACGPVCIVTAYGAPGDLTANGRGVRVPLQPLDGLVAANRAAMEACLADPEAHAAMASAAHDYAVGLYTWDAKAAYTARIYDAVMARRSLADLTDYL